MSATGDGWLSAADPGILCCGAEAVVARDGGLHPRESGKTSRRESERLAEGFCAHTAVAIMRSIQDGSIELR